MFKGIVLKVTAIIAVSMLCSSGFATRIVTPGIRGSDHDFLKNTGGTWTRTGSTSVLDEICVFCHAPHGANGAVQADAPLWNHALTNATFTPYTSDTLKAVPGQPNGTSKLCLSCHDGTVALEAYGKYTTGTHFISDAQFGTGAPGSAGSKVIGTDLTNDHPVSFVFDAALVAADPGLNDPTTTQIITGINSAVGTIAEKLLDKNGYVQCTSCHEPHNKYGINKLLKVNNTGSALCLTCHNK